ncbi:MAG: Nudix family hydrolase [Wenzhouxiangellaceae bacterium]|nr:Nudix family hydrolase [Wenzhouxiangellaceae bacterium]
MPLDLSTSDTAAAPGTIEVAAAVLRDAAGRVLVSRRPAGRHLAGMWEFPGGKIEPGETAAEALVRELREELGIESGPVRPLVAVRHEYPEEVVRLRLHEVHSFSGSPHGAEGQDIRWVAMERLAALDMPPADRPMIRLLELDGYYAISPSPAEFDSADRFVDAWRACLEAGFRLLRLQPGKGEHVDAALVRRIDESTREFGARWIGAGDLQQCFGWPSDGIHLDTRQLMTLDRRPLPDDKLVIASCHDLEEMLIADSLDADLVTLAPVQHTHNHSDAQPLGWDDFERLVRRAPLPVLAQGGVRPGDWPRARALGAFGVAGVDGFGWR